MIPLGEVVAPLAFGAAWPQGVEPPSWGHYVLQTRSAELRAGPPNEKIAALIVGCKGSIEMEHHVMSFIRSGYVVSTRLGCLIVLFSVLLALAEFGHGAASAQEVKQIKLTDQHIQSFMVAYEDIAKVYDGADSDKPDP